MHERDGGRIVDQLTGTADIGELISLERDLDRHARDSREEQSYGIVLIDVEGLRSINAEHGTMGGDEVLKELAHRLRTLNPDSCVARVDFDKFAVLASSAGHTDVSRLARQLKYALTSEAWFIGQTRVDVHVHATALAGPVTTRGESHLLWAAMRAQRTKKVHELERRVADLEQQLRLGGLQAEVGLFRAELAISLYRHDALTGLLSRLGYSELRSTIATPYALAFLDVDNLRKLNKTPGLLWDAGDKALVVVARLLEGLAPDVIAIRWGGDEFLVLLPGLSAPDARELIVSRIRELHDVLRVGSTPVTLSGGVAYVSSEDRHHLAMDAAEELAEKAKVDGRNQVLVATTR